MKVIVINTAEQKVEEREIEGTLADYQKIVGGWITAVNITDTDCFYVNDEGLYDTSLEYFEYKGAHQPFKGNGVVVGTDAEGETIEPTITVEQVREAVSFPSQIEVALKYG